MNETVIPIEEAAACLPELVERIHANHEAAVIVKSGRSMVRIVPVAAPGVSSEVLIAFLRRWRIEHPEPDDQFSEAIGESRRTVRPPRNPWD